MTTETVDQAIRFHRLSVRYDQAQDRLRVDAVDNAGSTCALWLTRRLAGAWLATLADWLQQASPAAAAVPAEARAQAVAMESAVVAGRREREVTPAVPAASIPRLVSTIDLARQRGQWSIVFKAPADDKNPAPLQGVLKCDSATVHQLAQAVVKQVQAAHWTEPLALAWLADSVVPASAAPGTLLN